MEIIFNELALYGRKNECARTDNVFLPISEVCNGTVSLDEWNLTSEIHCWRLISGNLLLDNNCVKLIAGN